jgi:tRNA dimethylallyltransferase
MKNIWLICGPTASGKTAFSIALARKFSAEILSADSRQIFTELNIGVARPDPEELAQVPHHFIGKVSITEDYSAGKFAREARQFSEAYFTQNDHLVVCGGTGLYIRAFLEGVDRLPVAPEIRTRVNEELDRNGMTGLRNKISEMAPDLLSETESENPRRLQRLLEWIYAGKPVETFQQWPGHWKVNKLGLELNREELYQRINQRVDGMMEKGLWEEALALYHEKDRNALKTVGYQELFLAMDGIISKEEAVEKIKQHSRNYAKRQLTWFKKDTEIRWLSKEDQAALLR